MKYLSKIAFAIIISSTFFACSDEISSVKQEELNLDLSDLKLNLEELNFNKPHFIFEYQNSIDAKSKSDLFLKSAFDEIAEIKKSNKEITNVLFRLSFDKGIAKMENIYILNAKDRIILNAPKGGNLNTKSLPYIDWDSLVNGGRCPEGWTDHGSCQTTSCVAETTQSILTDPNNGINSSGDNVTINYNRGLFGVRICSTNNQD